MRFKEYQLSSVNCDLARLQPATVRVLTKRRLCEAWRFRGTRSVIGRTLSAIATVGSFATLTPAFAEDPKNIIAAQLRDQGYQCDQPQSAVHDLEASKPDEAVWVLQCENAKYRLRLVPNLAAKVERIQQ